MLEYGKRYKWSDIVEDYPERYVFCTDVDFDDNDQIVEVTFLGISTKNDREDVAKQVSAKKKGPYACFWTRGALEEGVFCFLN